MYEKKVPNFMVIPRGAKGAIFKLFSVIPQELSDGIPQNFRETKILGFDKPC